MLRELALLKLCALLREFLSRPSSAFYLHATYCSHIDFGSLHTAGVVSVCGAPAFRFQLPGLLDRVLQLPKMMSMTELFNGPVEPTWFYHPQYPGYYNSLNGPENVYENPYAPVYADDHAFPYGFHPTRYRPAMSYNIPGADPAVRARGAYPRLDAPHRYARMHPFHGQFFLQGAGNGAATDREPFADAVVVDGEEVQSLAQREQIPARPGVLQPMNSEALQTVHFRVPLCCDACEVKIQKSLLDVEGVQHIACDQWKKQVTVTSSVPSQKLLKRLQKIKERSTLWLEEQANTSKAKNRKFFSNGKEQQKQIVRASERASKVVDVIYLVDDVVENVKLFGDAILRASGLM